MPRYFFSLHDHIVETDDTGTDLPDRAAARLEAVRFAGEVLRDDPTLLHVDSTLAVVVTDEQGVRLFTVDIRAIEAVD